MDQQVKLECLWIMDKDENIDMDFFDSVTNLSFLIGNIITLSDFSPHFINWYMCMCTDAYRTICSELFNFCDIILLVMPSIC